MTPVQDEQLPLDVLRRAHAMVGDDDRRARIAWTLVSEPGRERPSVDASALRGRQVELGAVEAWHQLVDGRLGCGGAALGHTTTADVDAEISRLARVGARTLVPGDDEWPIWYDPVDEPMLLHVLGHGSLVEMADRAVAVVGSRASTGYGEHVARDLGAGLASRGWSVTSGAAYGIDAAAHQGALAVDGPCIAVLPCGPDQAYPRANAPLIRAVAEHGVVVTELRTGAVARRHRFLSRNRIIAALSRGTVVVEAGLRSGSLNTAGWAEHLGRQVMAVPGPVTSMASAGCNERIRNGASLVTDAAEILTLVAPVGEFVEAAEEALGPARPADRLQPVERRIHDALLSHRERSVDEIAEEALLTVGEVLDHLAVLEVDGWARRNAGGWCRGTGPDQPDRRGPRAGG